MKFYVHGVNGLAVEADPLTWAQPPHRSPCREDGYAIDILGIQYYIACMVENADDSRLAPLRLPRDMADLIDTYWHRERLPSRSAAIRELLAYALDAKLAKPAKEQRR